jgi:putative transposase
MAVGNTGNKQSRAGRARDVALFRYALVRSLADPELSSAERGALVRELAGRVQIGPFGEPVRVSRASLDRWIRAWRAGGFDALLPTQRQIQPRTEAGVLELAQRLKRERPARTAAHIVRIIEQERGWAPSARTVQRLFARLGLNVRPDGTVPAAFGRFEAEVPDELWVSDGLHGPIVEGGRAVLFALLDDHSRYAVGYRWGHGENTLGMQTTLHDAVKTHGCPRRLYADNGSAYRCAQLGWSLAVLDIRLVHSQPGRPQGRGKIERWNRTVRDQFLVEIQGADGPGGGTADSGSTVTTLAELNRLFSAWIHHHYHRSVHSETGATPAARYHAEGRAPAPRPDPTRLRRAFLWREQRKVTACSTVSLHGNRYEVDCALVGRTVDLLFVPFDLTIIEVEYQGRPMGQASPHTITRHVHPNVTAQAPEAVQATGINYLHLLDDARHQAGQAIHFPALADPHPDLAQDHPEHPDQPSLFANPEHPEHDGSQQT